MKPPQTIDELLARCRQIEGLSFAQLAEKLSVPIPAASLKRKGWVGMLLESALGADANTSPQPDFKYLQIELKTLPLNAQGKPCESTFVSVVSLLNSAKETWLTSTVYRKLSKVLWVLVEGDSSIPYRQRRIGQALLWSPDPWQMAQLKQDWSELTEMVLLGQLECIDAGMGTYLQIRPKAANGKSLCDAFDSKGNKIKTLPRGFYLRTTLTHQIINSLAK